MSAGGISYSGLRTTRKVTLPSVEMWNSDLNVLRDPPKSIHTRRKDKVGETQSILLAQDESGDRICEMINVYARGVNPMVSVSYDNFSRNGGSNAVLANQKQASLPYKVENVRPPILRQEDLLPLSRMPRNWFYSFTNPSLPGVVNESSCNETGSSIHDNVLQACAYTNKKVDLVEDLTAPKEAPRHTLLTEIPHLSATARPSNPLDTLEGYDTGPSKSSINLDKVDVVAQTKRGRDQATSIHFSSLNRKVVDDPLRTEACSNFGAQGKGMDMTSTFLSIDSGKTQDALNANARTNLVSGETDLFCNFDTKDKKQIQQKKLFYQAFSKKNKNSGSNVIDKMDTNKFINKKKILCVAQTNKRVKENFVHPHQESSVSTIPVKEYLSKNVKTVPTSVYQHIRAEVANPEKTKGLIETPLHSYNVESMKSSTHQIQSVEIMESVNKASLRQNVLHASAQANKTSIGNFADPFENANLKIHNVKRTPIHSIKTNTVSPFSKINEPETIREQKRRALLCETQTTGVNIDQIRNNADSYSVQSTNADKLVYNGPVIGSFEGQGSAIPQFDQYDNYRPGLRPSAKEEVRARTKDFFTERYPAPMFVPVSV